MKDYFELQQQLIDTGREALLFPLTSAALDQIAKNSPESFAELLAVAERATLDSARASAVLAHDLARVLSRSDPHRATALFERFKSIQPLFQEVMPIAQLPRATLLLWRAADSDGVVAHRYQRLDSATNDRDLAFGVLAAELAGKHDQIVAYVLERMSSRRPAALARAVCAAGFAQEDSRLASVFHGDRLRHGFLADVAECAKRAYDEASWARHWFEASRVSSEGVDVWRFGELAIASADARAALWIEEGTGSPLFEQLRPLARSALGHRADWNNRERARKLFFQNAPPDYLLVS